MKKVPPKTFHPTRSTQNAWHSCAGWGARLKPCMLCWATTPCAKSGCLGSHAPTKHTTRGGYQIATRVTKTQNWIASIGTPVDKNEQNNTQTNKHRF